MSKGHDDAMEITKFVLEQIFTCATGNEVEKITLGTKDGFMSKMTPSECTTAVIMMGQLQEEILGQVCSILEGMAGSGKPELVEFANDVGAFIAQGNVDRTTKMLDVLIAGGTTNDTVHVRPENTH